MATMQFAAFTDSSSGWGDNTFPYSGDQLTHAAATIARFFETVANETPLARTTTSVERIFETQQGSGLDDLQGTPDDLVEWSTYGTDVREPQAAVIRDEFEKLFEARGYERDRLAQRLLSLTDAESLVQAAFDQFRERGNAERLVLVAALLEEYGHAAIRPLRRLARAGAPECEYFIDALADLAEDASFYESTAELLRIWSKHPVRDVRLRLVDVSNAFPRPLRNWMLNVLVDDSDEEVSEAAREYLQSRA
jgi:hypothetical protein